MDCHPFAVWLCGAICGIIMATYVIFDYAMTWLKQKQEQLSEVRDELSSLRQAIDQKGESSSEKEVLLERLIVVQEKLSSLRQAISR
jgi:Tfp pilus assembly protein PilO